MISFLKPGISFPQLILLNKFGIHNAVSLGKLSGQIIYLYGDWKNT